MTFEEFTAAEERIVATAKRMLELNPDWVTFYRDLFGVDGWIDREFQWFDDRRRFESTQAYRWLQWQLAELRKTGPAERDDIETQRVVTVRLPRSLHRRLLMEAHEKKTSLNKLCVSKLLQAIDAELVPADGSKA
ncbi:MAG: toxin-antitoxin system HicB family antitoxin [Pirellulales bacterium]